MTIQKLTRHYIGASLPALALLLMIAANTTAQFRLKFPEQTAGGPAYARIEKPFFIHTNEWAAVLLYRQPSCIPEDFNLLQVLDFEGFPDNPRVFRCPLTVEGFEMRETPEPIGFPKLVFTRGTGAVPVWFVRWSELEAAIADDQLTVVDLRNMESLTIGYASFFEETLDFYASGENQRLVMVAAGTLLDGRHFQLHYTFAGGAPQQIKIAF